MLAISLTALVTVTSPTLQADDQVDVEWTGLIGGIHQILDVCIPDTGFIWVGGAGIARVDPTTHILVVTDWARGLRIERLATNGDGDGWAIANVVDSHGDALFARLERGRIVERVPSASSVLTDLVIDPATGDGWAIGLDTSNISPLFVRLANGRWSRQSDGLSSAGNYDDSALNALDVSSPESAAAVSTSGIIWIWDGRSWSKKFSAPAEDIYRINDIEYLDNNEIWLAGGQIPPDYVLLHMKSGSWRTVPAATESPLVSIDVSADGSGWAVGREGTIHRIEKGTMRPVTMTWPYGADLHSLWTVRSNPLRGMTLAAGDAGQLVTLSDDGVEFFGEANRDGNFSSVLQLTNGDLLLGGSKCNPPFCGLNDRGSQHASLLRYSSGQYTYETLPPGGATVFDLVQSRSDTILAIVGDLATVSSDLLDHGTVLRGSSGRWDVATSVEGFGLRRVVPLGDGHFMALGYSYARYPESILIELDGDGREIARTLLPGTFASTLASDGPRSVIVGGKEDTASGSAATGVVVQWTNGTISVHRFPESVNAAVAVAGRGTPWAFVNAGGGIVVYQRNADKWTLHDRLPVGDSTIWSNSAIGDGTCVGILMGFVYCEEAKVWGERFSVSNPSAGIQVITDIHSLPRDDGSQQVVISGIPSLAAVVVMGQQNPSTNTPSPSMPPEPTSTATGSPTTATPNSHVIQLPVAFRPR